MHSGSYTRHKDFYLNRCSGIEQKCTCTHTQTHAPCTRYSTRASLFTHTLTHTHTPQADFLPNPHIPIASTDKLVFHTQKLLHLCVDPGASLMEALHTHSTRGYLPKSMLMHSTRARTHTHPHNPYTILYPYFNPRLFLNPDIRLCTQHNMHFQTPNQPESDPSCTPT